MKIERQLGDQEIMTLDKKQREIYKRTNRLTRFVMIWTGSCVIGGIIIGYFINQDLWIVLAVTVFIFIGIGLWVFFQEWNKDWKALDQMEELRARNLVTSIRVQTNEFYELSEDEDEGVYYLFQIAPDKILRFGGQDFYATKRFPSADFEIVVGKGRDGQIVFLETYSYGNKTKPLKKISGQKKWELLEILNPDEFQIIGGRLEQFDL